MVAAAAVAAVTVAMLYPLLQRRLHRSSLPHRRRPLLLLLRLALLGVAGVCWTASLLQRLRLRQRRLWLYSSADERTNWWLPVVLGGDNELRAVSDAH